MVTTIKKTRGRPKKITVGNIGDVVAEMKKDAIYKVTLKFNGKTIEYQSDTLSTLFTWITETLKTKLLISVEKETPNTKITRQKFLFIKEVRMIKGNKLREGIYINRLLKELQ